ncbi:hypothetical protein [Flavobacterium sp.]|uniref:hypothetical protein n=1 Tax=Flavobacterium sp. TaxID=239 RepID=UPI0035B0046F
MKKSEILDLILVKQKQIISNLEQTIAHYHLDSNLDEDDTLDPEDYSHQDEASEMKFRLKEILNKAKTDYNFIQNNLNSVHQSIENGALIKIEENGYIFIGVSIPPFVADNNKIITISEKAPIFSNIKDLLVGDKITIGNKTYTIITIE